MAQVSRSKASLRIGGENLIPSEISKILGCAGTTMYAKGDVIVSKKSSNKIIRKHGLWLLAAEEKEPENIDGQVKEIFSKINNDISVWKKLSAKYSIDLFCGVFMEQSNEGMEIAPEILSELGIRGIQLSLDIYDGAE